VLKQILLKIRGKGEEKSGKAEGLIAHQGEEDNIICLKPVTTNPANSWARIMKMEEEIISLSHICIYIFQPPVLRERKCIICLW
jgi:hypothetical protein